MKKLWRDIRVLLHAEAARLVVRLLVGLLGLAGATELVAPEPVLQPARDAALSAVAPKR